MAREIESPSPVPSPCRLVVKNGSKIRSRDSGGIPGPVSVTVIATKSSSARALILTRWLGRSTSVIAWKALMKTFMMTCVTRPRGTTSGGRSRRVVALENAAP